MNNCRDFGSVKKVIQTGLERWMKMAFAPIMEKLTAKSLVMGRYRYIRECVAWKVLYPVLSKSTKPGDDVFIAC